MNLRRLITLLGIAVSMTSVAANAAVHRVSAGESIQAAINGAAPGDTIWMGAADRDGRVVSFIQSVYWEFGSGVVLEDTGTNTTAITVAALAEDWSAGDIRELLSSGMLPDGDFIGGLLTQGPPPGDGQVAAVFRY